MSNLEQLEQDAKDRGLIKTETEHAFWGDPKEASTLKLNGYVEVSDGGATIDVGDVRLYKIPR